MLLSLLIYFAQNLQALTEAGEQRVCEVLAQLSETVQKRRIMMYQYFKDYDRVRAFSHWGRVGQGRIAKRIVEFVHELSQLGQCTCHRCHCPGGPHPTPWLADPPPPHQRDGWLGRSAFTILC